MENDPFTTHTSYLHPRESCRQAWSCLGYEIKAKFAGLCSNGHSFLKVFILMLHTRSSMLDKVDQVFTEIVYAHDTNDLDQAQVGFVRLFYCSLNPDVGLTSPHSTSIEIW